MIAKYPSKCTYCGKPIVVGRDQYDVERKVSYHIECEEEAENRPPSPASFKLADDLGFIQFRPELPADGLLLLMSGAAGGDSAGRAESASRGLFDSVRAVHSGAECT